MTDSSPALTPERRRTLDAFVARILPGSEGPGALQTGAAAAVENAIRHHAMRALRKGFEQLLDRIEADATAGYACNFAACTPDAQDALMRAVEDDTNPWTQFLFRQLVAFSLEGLLGDPIHGGNRDFHGWNAIGLRAEDARSGLCYGARAD